MTLNIPEVSVAGAGDAFKFGGVQVVARLKLALLNQAIKQSVNQILLQI